MSKNKHDDLGNRMKTYEGVTRTYLTRRTPVIIRLDGCHFHTFTKGFHKPYDLVLWRTMQETMKKLCESIQNCVLGYTQSDEITLVLCDYKKLDTAAWFDNNIQKMCSVSSSLATMIFNREFPKSILDQQHNEYLETNYDRRYFEILNNAAMKPVVFDSRVFNIPKEEVCNCLIWRQKDAIRNSIAGLGQKYFSHRRLEGVKSKDIIDMLLKNHSIDWNKDVSIAHQRGSCCIKTEHGWKIDNDIPLFTDNRDYINSRIIFE